jgi:hypothetical protein
MTVISLSQFKKEREPHWSGQCVCLGCRHEWTGVGEIGHTICLECPSCNLPKGVTKNLFGADDDDSFFICSCGNEALTAVYTKARPGIMCMNCGNDCTEGVLG